MCVTVAGYYGDGFNAIVVLTACHLPDKRRRDYNYVMDNLFLYVHSSGHTVVYCHCLYMLLQQNSSRETNGNFLMLYTFM